MNRAIRVYVSSTYEDLKDYRDKVNKALVHLQVEGAHVQPIAMEGYHASDDRPIDKCTRDARSCDIYLCIVGVRYGWVSADLAQNPEGLSITELEYRAARDASPPKKILFLLAHEDCTFPTRFSRDNDGPKQDKYHRFLSEARKRCVATFTTADGCEKEAVAAVRDAVTDILAGAAAPDDVPAPTATPAPRIRIGGEPLYFGLAASQFKNRTDELDELRRLVKGPDPVAIVIKGEGGMGKSELAGRFCSLIHAEVSSAGGVPRPWALEAPQIGAVIYEGLKRRFRDEESGEESYARLNFTLATFWEKVLGILPHAEREAFRRVRDDSAKTTEQVAADARARFGEGLVVLLLDNLEDVLLGDGAISNPELRDVLRVFLAPGSPVRLVTTTRVMPQLPCLNTVVLGSKPLPPMSVPHCLEILREKDPGGLKRTGLSTASDEALTALAEACGGVPRALDLAAIHLERESREREFRGKGPLTVDALARDAASYKKGVLNFLLKRIWDHAEQAERLVATTLALASSAMSGAGILRATGLPEKEGQEAIFRLRAADLIRYDENRRGYLVVDRDRDYLRQLVPPEDFAKRQRDLARAAAADKVPPGSLETADQLRAYGDEFQHLLAAGDARAAWDAISPICPYRMWEKNLGSEAFPWFEALLNVADERLRADILPEYASQLWNYGRWNQLLEVADEMLEHAEKEGDEHLKCDALNNKAWALYCLARYVDAEPLYRRRLELATRLYGEESAAVATSLNNLALLLKSTNRHREAEPLYRRALAIGEKTLGSDHPNVATHLNNLANLLSGTNRHQEAEPLYRRALAIRERAYGPDHPDVAHSLNSLASLLSDTNRHREAEPLYRRALAIREKAYGPDHPNVATNLNNLAILLADTNRHRGAEPLYRRSLAIHEKAYVPEHPQVATDLNNLANLFSDTNRHREAEPLYRRSLAIDEKAYGPDHPEVATDLNNLANLLRETNRHREAEPLHRRALAIREKAYGPDHPAVATALNNLALLLSEANLHREAEPLYRRAIAIYEMAFGPNHPEVAKYRGNLARVLAETGRGADAVPLLEHALTSHVAAFGETHWSTGVDRRKLAAALLSRGQPGDAARALEEARRAIDILSTSLSPDHWRVAYALRARAAAEIANGLGAGAVASLRESVRIWEALDFVPLKDTADTLAELAEALAAVGDAAGADAARAKSADYRRRYDEQEAAAAKAFPMPPLPDWVEALMRGA